MSNPLYCPWIVYLPLKAKSEWVTPSDLPVGGVVDTMFMFHAACPASPTRSASPVSATRPAPAAVAAGDCRVRHGRPPRERRRTDPLRRRQPGLLAPPPKLPAPARASRAQVHPAVASPRRVVWSAR